MALTVLKRRELYVDVTLKEDDLEEIFLYQVDFLKDDSFRGKEYVFRKEEKKTEEGEEQEEEVDITEQFKLQWEELADIDAPIEVFATDAELLLTKLFFELQKKWPDFVLLPFKHDKKEMMHDFISMGKVTSMSAFDEQQHLSSGIRRRMKEKYHERVDEVKMERSAHIFLRQMAAGSPYDLELFVTDGNYRIRKNILLPKTSNEETQTLKLAEIFAAYPDADLVIDKISIGLYKLLHNISSFMSMTKVPTIFSLESMFHAVGKSMPTREMVENYLLYIKNLEDMRFGRFVSEQLYSTHCFYLPVRISGEKDWKKQFKKNVVWKESGANTYSLQTNDNFKGKYVLRAGKEQFVLKLKSVSVKRYLRQYAVLCMEVENHCYPGEMDRNRINELSSCLFPRETTDAPDAIELKIKTQKQAYSLSAVQAEGNENQVWLNGLLLLGNRKKDKKKHRLVFTALSERMYCIESKENGKEEEVLSVALVRHGALQEVESRLAKWMIPSGKKKAFGRLTSGQKRKVRTLYEFYRYLRVSFGAEYEGGKAEAQKLFHEVEAECHTQERIMRLNEKFQLFFG